MFEHFAHRSTELERLDRGEYTPSEYARWQREMVYIHAMFGEERALNRTLLRDIKSNGTPKFSVLDVGAGSGTLLKKVREWCGDRESLFVGAERHDVAAKSISDNQLSSVQCDALHLPFASRSFDYVLCSLFMHHLNDDDSVSFLNEIGRVAQKRIYVVDLNRSAFAYYVYKLFGLFVLQKFTREDGALSILRSRTPEELSALAARAGLSNIKVERSFVNRLIMSAELY